MTAKGDYCPTVALAPTSVEGHALDMVLMSSGCWRRAGMGGTVTGLDMAELLARLPGSVDHEAVRVMAQAAEGPVMAAVLERAAEAD